MSIEIPLTCDVMNKSDHYDETRSPTKAIKNWKLNGQTLVPILHDPWSVA